MKEEKLYFDIDKYKVTDKSGSTLFTSEMHFRWFKTSFTGKDILLKLDGNKTVDQVINEISDEYELPRDVIEKDIIKFCKTALEKELIFKSKEDVLDARSNNKIRSIYLDITNACNLKCRYCNKAVCDESEGKFLIPEVLKKYLDKINEKNNGASVLVNVTGGEPLLHKEIEKIFEVIKSYDYKIGLLTNGMLIDEKKAEVIEKYCDYVMLPLDSAEKEINDEIRGKGAYEGVVKAMAICKKYKIPFFISTTPTKYSIDNMEKIMSFCYESAAEGIIANEPILVKEDGTDISKKFDYSQDKLRSKYSYMQKRSTIINSWKNSRLKYGKEKKVNVVFVEDTKRCMNNIFNVVHKESCGAGINEILISVDGNVYPCHVLHLKEYNLGSIEEYIDKKKPLIKVKEINECNKCVYNIFCLGGCRAEALYRNKSINAKYPDCDYAKNVYEQTLETPLRPAEMKDEIE
jgi:radical SAM protein with 4Fe4S-binding SPASM domain